MWRIPILACVVALSLSIPGDVSAQDSDDKIQKAVNVVKGLCLAGKEYDITADANGNITLKSFLPGAAGSLSVNVKEADGAVVLRDELRLIGDRDVRECTARHIGRIMDAIFETSPPSETSNESSKDYTNIRRARFIGMLPGDLALMDFVDTGDEFFYRFSVSEPIYLSLSHSRISNNLGIAIRTEKGEIVRNVLLGEGEGFDGIFLTPRDYYIQVWPYNTRATPYLLNLRGDESD